MNEYDIDIKEQKVVTDKDLKKDTKENKIVLNFGGDELKDGETPVLPDATNILDEVIKILECMNTNEMKELKKTNVNVFEQVMEEKFPDFSFKYYSVFKIVLSGEDITPLFMMLNSINEVNTGKKSFEDAQKGVGHFLNKFIPPELLAKLADGELGAKDIKASANKKNKKKH